MINKIFNFKYSWEDGVVVRTELIKSVERAFERFAKYIGAQIVQMVL